MRQSDGEVEIKIHFRLDPSNDNRVLLYCYRGNWEQEGSRIVAELSRTDSQKPALEDVRVVY